MKYLINLFLYVAMGVVLGTAGVGANNWQYWAVFGCAFCIAVNAMLW